MASKKDKILESAQRFVLKGQIDKAIKDYQQVVAMEPGDIRPRQRLAELLVRDNRKDEAIQQYEDIGKHYADNCYFLKAIAIYKQIQRLNPGNPATALTIAHLNHQQGLIGNALAEYAQVAALYEKEGDLKEALKVVEKMLGVDAEHVATRMKHAELLYSTGSADQSRQAFAELAGTLRGRGLQQDAASVDARARELFPEEDTLQPAPYFDGKELSADGFGGGEEVPGVQGPAAAPWESPIEEPVLPDWDAPGGELPDPFAAPAATSQPEPAPAAGTASPATYEAPAPWDTEQNEDEAEGSIAWEEEIELDLDDDMFDAAPAPEPAQGGELPAAFPEPAPAPSANVELPLDFSLELNFDEVGEELDGGEPEETAPVVELDLDQGGELELTLPEQEAPFGDFSWGEQEGAEPQQEPDEQEPAQLADYEEAELELEPEPETELELELEPESELELEPEPELELEPEAELEPAPEPAAPDAAEPVQVRGWEEIFPEAAGSGADFDIEELESHYDLGIGYKEMGMYAGAIKEFQIAAANPQRRFDCMTLQAICYRDKGEAAQAEELLRRGLDLTVITRDERTCLNYELAVLAEGRGAVDEAIGLYREVIRANPGYQDASDRLSALSGEEVPDIIDLELEEGS
ncbi:tetratricopeptide repeat protein [Geomonas subterranea]|uniref:Tetratricopeptide repeat protein n=1 Tax=Geomonas subterranea TaxID=2847989 RepID=A0ABX8LIJ6_9BACT|nr:MULTISPECIES: tetratricopeptide repeat protein [Geomonas]QXE91151.1 tetratricopeptide repeat protein [Geomonas subterranea]QXM10762.1 tetratricopeptide repeat protein [Geomonas subterranea]